MPELKHEQMQDFPRAVADAAPMLADAALDFRSVEIPSLHAPGLKQDFQKSCSGPAAEPMHQRHGKSLFFAVHNLVWHSQAFRQLLQDVLGLPGANLPL